MDTPITPRFFLADAECGGAYLVQADCRAEWEAWNWDGGVAPAFARPVAAIAALTFTDPRLDD